MKQASQASKSEVELSMKKLIEPMMAIMKNLIVQAPTSDKKSATT